MRGRAQDLRSEELRVTGEKAMGILFIYLLLFILTLSEVDYILPKMEKQFPEKPQEKLENSKRSTNTCPDFFFFT